MSAFAGFPAQIAAAESSGSAVLSELPAECEVALALAAAPTHLQDEAGVWVWTEGGYRESRRSSNGFSCIVNRDDPYSVKPTCFDGEGARTILPKILFFGKRLAAGATVEQIRQAIEQGFSDGRFKKPGPGVAYMLSHFNRPWDPSAGRLALFPPHLMFYAPDLSNSDIGFARESFKSEPFLPFVGYQGPHGYMIVRVGDADPGLHRISNCPEWLVTGDLPIE